MHLVYCRVVHRKTCFFLITIPAAPEGILTSPTPIMFPQLLGRAALQPIRSHSNMRVLYFTLPEDSFVGFFMLPQVELLIRKHKQQLLAERYRFNMGLLIGECRFILPYIRTAIINGLYT